MDTNWCNCGAEASHKCTLCNPLTMLCLDCIKSHISRFPKDGIIPLHSISKANGASSCEICSSPRAISLQVLNTKAVPVCKSCKKALKNEVNSVFIPIKWKEIVISSADIQQIYIRNQILSKALEEIDRSYSSEGVKDLVFTLRDSIIASAYKSAEKKCKELDSRFEENTETVKTLREEVEKQIVKSKPDINTLGGKLVNSLLTSDVPYALLSNAVSMMPEDTAEIVQSIFDSIKIQSAKSSHNVYLFNPGKMNLTKINLEEMTKIEILFNRNWTFESSWCELKSGDIFFCGGNGLTNSEVLIVDVQKTTVSPRRDFNGRAGHGIIEIQDFVYVFGGNKSNCTDRYSFTDDEWSILTDLPQRISRISICKHPDGVFMAGIDCSFGFIYNIQNNTFITAAGFLEAYKPKNKIVFTHNNLIYCMCGDKLYFTHDIDADEWNIRDIADRDWWSYSKPVIYNNCAYFIKYFVRNLWRLNLATFELNEIFIQDIPSVSN